MNAIAKGEPKPQNQLRESDANEAGGDAQTGVRNQLSGIVERVNVRADEQRMRAEQPAFNRSGDYRRDYDRSCELLIEIADDLLECECHRRDRRVERGGDGSGCSHRKLVHLLAARDRKHLRDQVRKRRANLNSRPFAPEACTSANAQRRYHRLAKRNAHGNSAVVHRIRDLNLRDTAAPSLRCKVVNQQAGGESSTGRHYEHPQGMTAAMTRDCPLDQGCRDESDQPVITYGDQSARDGNRDGEYKVLLIGRETNPMEYARGV